MEFTKCYKSGSQEKTLWWRLVYRRFIRECLGISTCGRTKEVGLGWLNFSAVTSHHEGPPLALELRWFCRVAPCWGKEAGSSYVYMDRPVMDAHCPWEGDMTLGEVVFFSLERFHRYTAAMRASVLRTDLGRDHSIHYSRALSSTCCRRIAPRPPPASLNTQAGVGSGEMLLERACIECCDSSLAAQGKGWGACPPLTVWWGLP